MIANTSSNIHNLNFERNTFIGFDQKEIDNSTNEELLGIRASIYSYLKSTKLKKRNANFMEAYLRINQELTARGILRENKNKLIFKRKESDLVFTHKKSLDSTDIASRSNSNAGSDEISVIENVFLQKKSRSLSFEVEIPSFLNDNISIKRKRKSDSDLPQTHKATKDQDLLGNNIILH